MSLQYQLAYTFSGFKWFATVFATLMVMALIVRMVVYHFSSADRRMSAIDSFIAKYICPFSFVIGIALFSCAILIGHGDNYDLSMIIEVFAFLIICYSVVINAVWKREYDRKTVSQCLTISLLLFVWGVSAYLSSRTIKEYVSVLSIFLFTVIINLVFWIIEFVVIDTKSKRMTQVISFDSVYSKLKKCIPLCLVLILQIVFTLDTLHNPFLWDNGCYYRALAEASRWDFTTGMVTKLNMCSHLAGGYALLSEVGIWLFASDPSYGVHFIQLVLALFSSVVFYCIVCRCIPNRSKIDYAMMTAVFAFSPALFGQMPSLNPDYGMLMFTVWFVCAVIYDYKLFQIAAGLLLCFTKEPAVFIYAGIVIGVFLWKYANDKSERNCIERFWCAFNRLEWLAIVFPMILWVSVFGIESGFFASMVQRIKGKVVNYSGEGWTTGGLSVMSFNGLIDDATESINQFGINLKYIGTQLEHIFLMNCMWILLIVMVVCGIVKIALSREQKVADSVGNDCPVSARILLYMCICGMLGFMVIELLYITHTHFRYIAPMHVFIILVAILLVSSINKSIVRNILYSVIAICFFSESLWNWDPITNAMGTSIILGEKNITNIYYGKDGSGLLNDYTLYNRQGYIWGDVLTETFKEIQLTDSTLLIVPKQEDDIVYSIFGFLAGYFDGPMWDCVNGEYTIVPINETVLCQYGTVDFDGNVQTYTDDLNVSDYDCIYYFNVPYAESYGNNAYINGIVSKAGLKEEKRIRKSIRGINVEIIVLSNDFSKL